MYDAENRLVKVEDFVEGNPTAAFTSTYRYDGLGRRIEKIANGQTTRYIYDGEDILLEYDGTNTLQARYTHGPGIDEPIAVTKGGATFFYHQDGLGSVTDLTDSAGTTAKSYAYDAYGNILESPGAVEQPYTYTGREFDSESGLYYYRARNYDPASGRFLQSDPVGFSGGLNLYQYVGSNPTNMVDPTGKFAMVLPLVLSSPVITTSVANVLGGLAIAAMIASAGDSQQAAQKQAEHDAYKARCNQSPPSGLDQCETAKWELERNKDCFRMRLDWIRRWGSTPGLEDQLAQVERSIKNAEARVRELCGCR